jgi:hypothetical protein
MIHSFEFQVSTFKFAVVFFSTLRFCEKNVHAMTQNRKELKSFESENARRKLLLNSGGLKREHRTTTRFRPAIFVVNPRSQVLHS